MAMEQLTLNIEPRETRGKGPARRLRAAGKLPAVLYGHGNNTTVTVDPKVVHKYLLNEGSRNALLSLKGPKVDGKFALIKDYQVDPLTRVLVHIDLLEVNVNEKIEVSVQLTITGKSIGVAEGGVLNIIERKLLVKCLPLKIPKHIDVDVTQLKIGASIHADQLSLPEGVERAGAGNPTIVACVPPTKEEEAAPSLAPTAEPEVITEKKPAEGDAAAPAAEAKDKEKK